MADVFNNKLKLGFGLMRLPKNPDGSIALVILNSGTEDQGYAIRICDQVIRISAPAGTISTLMIEE